MSIQGLLNIKKALTSLNPQNVRDLGEKPLAIALYANSSDRYRDMEEFLLRGLDGSRRTASEKRLTRGPDPAHALQYNLAIYDSSVIAPARALVYDAHQPMQMVKAALDQHEDLHLVLARNFVPFREAFADRVIAATARENTLFSLATALPDIVPNVIELPWAVAEFASDSAFITMNQIRMAFLLAAASDREIGYREQKSEIATVIGSAFGWRAIARQLVGKIPFGGGLLPKAAIAYAGTKVLGLSLDRLYSMGYAHSRSERDAIYSGAYQQGKEVAGRILKNLRPELAQKYVGGGKQRDHKSDAVTVDVQPEA